MKTNKLFWDYYASDFDAIYGTENSWLNNKINQIFRKTMKIRFEKTISAIPEENVSVIDIGCGPGHYCFSIAENGHREILGIDFSEKMIQIANDHARESGLENKLKFRVVNLFDFQSPRKFDYCIMMGFIEYFENPGLVLQKAVELTNKKIFISFPVAGGLLAFQRKLRYKKRCYLKLYKYEEIEKLLTDSGIKLFTIERIKRDFFVTINLN